MGFFDSLFSKRNGLTPEKKDSVDKSLSPDIYQSKPSLVSDIPFEAQFIIHPDIKNLIWIADGHSQNYSNNEQNKIFESNVFFFHSFLQGNEPSLIYTKLPLESVDDFSTVERPPYYPTYAGLTPLQKWIYLKFLENPYNSEINIGYVFILYYGLERHLLQGNYEEAFEVILKLRNVHSNSSFQGYSANALVLTCLCRQRADLLSEFMDSLDKKYEFNFSDDLFLFSKYSLKLPLTATDIMRLAKVFAFTNLNYIKNYPDLFEDFLLKNMAERFNSDSIIISDFITVSEFKNLRKNLVPIFANISIIDKNVSIPLVSENFRFKKAMNELLETTHAQVKMKLAELRKNGEIISNAASESKPKEVVMFDAITEKILLDELHSSKNHYSGHFTLMNLQKFYYKYRDLDDRYLKKCIEYCLKDIESLDEMQNSYYVDQVQHINDFPMSYNKDEIDKIISKNDPFRGQIPAFKRLSVIYEKQKEYQKAIDVCNLAIGYYIKYDLDSAATEFRDRLDKLSLKLKKECNG